jgi:hypothetical protein
MNIRARIVCAASSASLCLLGAAAHAEPVRTPVPDARPVMLAALQATDGTAHGVLTGEMADAITKRFEATSPIYIDVSTERRYREPGCSRLKVLFWQEGVRLPEAKAPRKQTIEFGINYCATGLPPKSLR